MRPHQIALSSPEDFRQYPSVLLSAPTELRRYENAVQPATEYRPLQCLLGYEAQLLLFIDALNRVGIKPWFLQAPDIFASDYSFSRLLDALGRTETTPSKILHVCFGMPWTTRILRRATNLAVSAGIENEDDQPAGIHSPRSRSRFPAEISGVLAYAPLRKPGRTTDERELPTCILDESFVNESATDQISGISTDRQNSAAIDSDLQIQSILEFSPEVWAGKCPSAMSRSQDFRRALIRRKMAMEQQWNPLCFILIPWNLANSQSIVPDLAQRLSSNKHDSQFEYPTILLPFNEDHSSPLQIQALTDACRASASPGHAETIFLMRVTSYSAMATLTTLVTKCWLDGSDPEWQWSARRLSSFGVRSLLISDPWMNKPAQSSSAGWGIDAAFSAEDSCKIRSTDGTGEIVSHARTVSVRGLRQLIQCSRASLHPSTKQFNRIES